MQNYISKNLTENITPADLAEVSLYSPWYSYRLFTHYLNITPAEYIRKLRLSASAIKLRDEHTKIADVAFEMGFGSVDGYQRAFYRQFGTNPQAYAQSPVPLYLFTPYEVQEFSVKERKIKMQEVKNVFISVVEKPERKVIIKRGVAAEEYWSYCQEVGCDVWGLLKSIKSISGEPVCLWLNDKYILPGTSRYVQGVEVEADYSGVVPEGFDIIKLPKAKYLRFQGEPFAEEDYEEAIEALWAAMKKFDLSTIGYEADNENPRIQLEPIGTRGYIELIPIC